MKLSMNLFWPVWSLFFASAEATRFQQLIEQVKQMLEDHKDAEIPGVIGMNRALRQEDMGLVNNYGCWCYFEENHGNGKGSPTDEIDQFCKYLHDGYQCIIMEMESIYNQTCVPWVIPYNSAYGGGYTPFGFTLENLREECVQLNPDQVCESLTCMVEGLFVQSFFSYAIFGGQINHQYRHQLDDGSPNFDPNDGSCPTVEVPLGPNDLECCGEYPIRYPFHNRSNSRQCCGTLTYNPFMQSCCDENTSDVKVTCD